MAKILYVWKEPYPWDVRAEKVCSAFKDAKHNVYILARNGNEPSQRENIDGIQIIRVGDKYSKLAVPTSLNPIWRHAIEQAIDEIKPQLVVVREMLLAEATAKVTKKKNIPIIMDMAENYPACMRDWKKYNKNMVSRFAVHTLKIPDKVEKNAVAMMDGIFVVCEEQVERLNEQYAFKPENTAVVHNTPMLGKFDTSKRKREFKSPLTLTHHGFLSAEKDITNLLLGFNLIASHIDAKLVIAGDGECFNDYKALLEKCENKEQIIMLGKYNYAELPNILHNTNIGVIPYQISDFNNYTIHNKVFDYFAAGIPVLASQVKPLERLLNETKSGIASDFTTPENAAQAIKNMIESDLPQMAENATLAAQNKYNWNVDAKNLLTFTEQYI